MGLIDKTIERIKPLDYKIMEKTQKKLDSLTKPQGSLGRLEEMAKMIAGMTGKEQPALCQKAIIVMAGDHGVVEEGVSAYPKEVTLQMVYNFIRGGAGINVLARHIGARVVVVDIGVAEKLKIESFEFRDRKINFGTANFTKSSAMTEEEAKRSIEVGIETVEEEMKKGLDIVGTGDMGIGNTTPSSAVAAAITGAKVELVTGRGTGIDDKMWRNKVKVIKNGLKVNKPNSKDALDVLQKVGGYEIGGIAGVILGAAANRIPVVIDGFISGAGALIAYKLTPKVKDYIIASHCSVEPGHRVILDYLKLKPLLNLDLRLGEGTGAALAINIIEASVKILLQMATFESAGVSQGSESRGQGSE